SITSSSSTSAGAGGAGGGVSYSGVAGAAGFHVGAPRWLFSVRALQRLLVDPAAFHADVYLHDFYAYATFDLGDLSTFPAASCACVLGGGQAPRPPLLSEVVYGREWLAQAAAVLQMQDGVKEFRRKAVQLYDTARAQETVGPVMRCTTYKEKQGFTVLLLLTPEHARLVAPAIRLARLFVHNIVD
ncbi:hypothetical protein Agub_g1608, partial [Astrephomene gubernaculifera]